MGWQAHFQRHHFDVSILDPLWVGGWSAWADPCILGNSFRNGKSAGIEYVVKLKIPKMFD
jgi:hypothetical protein